MNFQNRQLITGGIPFLNSSSSQPRHFHPIGSSLFLDSYMFKSENFLLTLMPKWVKVDQILNSKHEIRNKHECSKYKLFKQKSFEF